MITNTIQTQRSARGLWHSTTAQPDPQGFSREAQTLCGRIMFGPVATDQEVTCPRCRKLMSA